jgi:hypothetical protein
MNGRLGRGERKDLPNSGARYLGGWSRARTERRRPNPAEKKEENCRYSQISRFSSSLDSFAFSSTRQMATFLGLRILDSEEETGLEDGVQTLQKAKEDSDILTKPAFSFHSILRSLEPQAEVYKRGPISSKPRSRDRIDGMGPKPADRKQDSLSAQKERPLFLFVMVLQRLEHLHMLSLKDCKVYYHCDGWKREGLREGVQSRQKATSDIEQRMNIHSLQF